MARADFNIEEHEAVALLEEMASASGIDIPAISKRFGQMQSPPSPSSGSRGNSWQPDLRYRALIDRLPVVTFLASLDDTIQELYVSPQIEKLLGFTQDEWLENPILWFQQLHPEDREKWVAEFARTCSTGANFRAEYRLFARDGREVWVQGECQLIRNEEGRPLFLQGIAFDITHLKRAAAIEEAKRTAELASSAKSEFLARMSHEIRTPLNGVVGMIDLLRETELNANQQRYAQLARESADALLNVINDILDFSKIEAGKVELEAIEFDLLKLAEDLVELLSPLAQKKNLVLACFARPELPRCMVGDPNRIRQVLTNLMGNAMKFTGMGQITIRTSLQQMDARQMTVRMEVQDTGMGIPADRLDRLFKSFSQVDSSTTRKFGGTGLGLAICKRLVELMGGEIGVESQSGKGTTFWFTVKLAVAAGNSEAASDQTEKLRNLRVLAVEPDATQRKILAEHLDGFFFASEIAASVDEAIEKLNRGMRDRSPFDVALVRYDQPGAADYVQRIRVDAVASQTKSIAMLETDDATDEARISAAGFAAQVRYPLMRSRIFDAISTVIVERPKARVALQGKPESASTLNGLHLLVAEDNEMNQFVTQETLRRFGCTCEIVSDGSQAIEAMQQKKFDAVLMDCQMPVLDGLEATRRIREKEQVTGTVRIPIIALTAEAIQGDREKCLAVGMDGYVTKPINAKGLFSAISALVRPRESVLPPPVTAEAPVQNADAPADVETPPIQVESLLARCMQDADFARRTLEQFEKRTIEDVHRLERSIAEADAHLINRLAHNLKSVAAHVGAEKLRAIAFEIEQAGARCDLSMIEAQLGALCLEAQRCTEFIPQAISRLTQTGQAVRKP